MKYRNEHRKNCMVRDLRIFFVAGLTLAMLLPMTVMGQNFIPNPGFTGDTKGWQLNPAQWIFDETGGRNGGACVAVQNTKPDGVRMQSDPVQIAANTYYRMTLWCRSEAVDTTYVSGILFYAVNGTIPIFGNTALTGESTQWFPITHYFFSGDTKEAAMSFGSRFMEGKVWFDDAEMVPVTSAQLRENLVPNADFDYGEIGKFPISWTDLLRWLGDKRPPVKISLAAAGFIKGEKSLMLDGSTVAADGEGGVQSTYVPVMTGSNYVLSVWIKGTAGISARLMVDGFVGGQKAHWYQQKYVSASDTWHKETLEVKIPDESDAKYFMPNRFVRIDLNLKGTGIVWADDVTFKMK